MIRYLFILLGVHGAIYEYDRDGHLLGIFQDDAVHNVIHLFSGLLRIIVNFTGPKPMIAQPL